MKNRQVRGILNTALYTSRLSSEECPGFCDHPLARSVLGTSLGGRLLFPHLKLFNTECPFLFKPVAS
jgi:hypothetical protein